MICAITRVIASHLIRHVGSTRAVIDMLISIVVYKVLLIIFQCPVLQRVLVPKTPRHVCNLYSKIMKNTCDLAAKM